MKIKALMELKPGTIIRGFADQHWIIGREGNAWLLEGPTLSAWTPDSSIKFEEEYGPFTIIHGDIK